MNDEPKVEKVYILQTDGKSYRFDNLRICVVSVTPDAQGNMNGFIYFNCPPGSMASSDPEEK